MVNVNCEFIFAICYISRKDDFEDIKEEANINSARLSMSKLLFGVLENILTLSVNALRLRLA